jgi:hypothetical protein
MGIFSEKQVKNIIRFNPDHIVALVGMEKMFAKDYP